MKTATRFLSAAIMMTAVIFTSCGSNGEDGGALAPQFRTEKNTYFTDEDITFINESSGGSGTLSFEWNFGDGETSTVKSPVKSYEDAGIYVVKLTVSDGKSKASAQKTLLIDNAPEPDKGSMTLKWIGQQYLDDIRSVSPAVDNEDNVLMTSNDNKLHKFSQTDGSVIWSFDMWAATDGLVPTGHTLSSPSVDSDGTIYVGTGASANGRFYAINPDGTKKWLTSNDIDNGFWNKGNPAEPRIVHLTAAIGDNCVYAGNAGATGSVVAIEKATGIRKGYVANSAGTGGPAGGVSAGVLLNNDNVLTWYGGIYGLFTCSATTLDAGPATWGEPVLYQAEAQRVNTAVNCSMALDSEGTVYGIGKFNDDVGGASAYAMKSDGTQKWRTPLGTVGDLDQGGVAIDKSGVVYVTVKSTAGEKNGGVIALNGATGNILWKFGIAEDVSGSPAIDQNGNIHIATDKGSYYIITPDGAQDPVVVKQDLISLILESGSSYAEGWNEFQGKCWSSPVIADDGTIYVGITNMTSRSKSLLLALTNDDVTGLQADAPWPMKGQNRRHTNKQK